MLFVGNSGYQPKGFAPAWRPRLDDGVLDVRYLRADVPLSRTRFIISALLGALLNSRTYIQQEYSHIDVEVLGQPVAFACDGEVRARGNRFSFSAQDDALKVYRPEQAG
jgi:undecaprenyl-diphosphatase